MNSEVVDRLLVLNRDFYDRFALSFARTRGVEQAGLRRTLAYLPERPRVLDAGCGNGRLAHFLAAARPALTYVGLDGSKALLEMARGSLAQLSHVTAEFVLADIIAAAWEAALPVATFDAVYLLGVLHHVPSFELRHSVLHRALSLLHPEGVLIVSYWQFLDEARLRERVVAWSAAGIDPADTEAGDALLDWRRDGYGLRYLHHVDEAEATHLAHGSGASILETYYADGRTQHANLFQICRPHGIVADRT